MNNNEYPKEQLELLQAAYDMRMAQKDYFRQPSEYRKKVAIAKENRFNIILKPYLDAGLVTLRDKDTPEKKGLKQLDIFGNAQ
jgi:hypothetical protein